MLRSYLLFFMLLASATAGELCLTPEGASAYALQSNQTLAAARLRIEEARGRLQQSGRLSNPELELDFTRNVVGQEGSAGIAFVQRFPLTARLRHEKAITRAELAAAEAEVRDAERKLGAEVRTVAVKLLAFEGQRELRQKQLQNSQELSAFLLKRVATGEASAVDASQVELESRQIEVESLMFEADKAVLLGELRPLLGAGSSARIVITGELARPKALPAAAKVATLTARPDLVAAQSRVEAARSGVLEQRARRWEDIGVGASYSRERAFDDPGGIETEQVLGIRFSLPLPIWNKNSGRIREAEAAALRSEKELDAAQLVANSEVSAAIDAMSAYAKLVTELDNIVLPKATQIVEQLRSSYSSGQTPLTDVLRARTRLLELQRQRLDALRDYHLASIRHTAAIGRPISTSRDSK